MQNLSKWFILIFSIFMSACTFEATITKKNPTDISGETSGDTTAPTLSGLVSDGAYNNSLTQSPLLSWAAGSDADSGISKYQIALGTSSGASDALDWTDIGNVTSYTLSGLILTDGVTYFPGVRAVDVAGNISSVILGDGWIVDALAPTLPSALDDGIAWPSTTTSPSFSWTASVDTGTGLAKYQYSIGTAAGLSDVLA